MEVRCGRGRTASTGGILGPLVREVNFTQVDVVPLSRGAVDTAQVNISGNGNNQQHLSNHNIYIYIRVCVLISFAWFIRRPGRLAHPFVMAVNRRPGLHLEHAARRPRNKGPSAVLPGIFAEYLGRSTCRRALHARRALLVVPDPSGRSCLLRSGPLALFQKPMLAPLSGARMPRMWAASCRTWSQGH